MEKQEKQLQEFIFCNSNQLKKELCTELIPAFKQMLTEFVGNKDNNEPVLLKESQVVKLIGVSRSFLKKLREENELQVIQVRTSIFYDRDEVLAYFKRHKQQSKNK